MYFEKNERLYNELISLDTLELKLLIIDLIKNEKLSYVELSKIYTEKLEADNKQKTGSINTLGLMLGSYCMRDTSDLGRTSRKHLFESKMYGNNDGSIFGKMLDEEFKNTK